MNAIPRSALILGLAGLIPFLWGAATVFMPELAGYAPPEIGPRFRGVEVLTTYGTVILAFMSGVLWGFAAKATGAKAALGYGLSVIPALWAFAVLGGAAGKPILPLMAGFAGLLLLDALFWMMNMTPRWWMRLRIILTAVVLACLAAPLV
ncbi:DUF3429 domain-containing protein [Rhodovulum steppense]|uniref:Uncharacterized protein DUF3429 n=1 Tax=Rhodovulum steppense TaxID=540251 RepID=A0A4R1Z078_9RHOB|nr:DUF3429 domain-containing protein [Rhodovulum steppense]TCM86962.1 uncharacterized protein DUF3429 [Rhodovulum steppense]